jgi:hypothetical protein
MLCSSEVNVVGMMIVPEVVLVVAVVAVVAVGEFAGVVVIGTAALAVFVRPFKETTLEPVLGVLVTGVDAGF